MLNKLLASLALFGLWTTNLHAQTPRANTDESKVGTYTLPDPLVDMQGKKVATPQEWMSHRRPEVLRLFETYVYGKTPTPPKPIIPRYEVLSEKPDALDGIALRRMIRIHFSEKTDGPSADVLLYIPKQATAERRVPAFLGLNLRGNHGVTREADIPISTKWFRNNPAEGAVNNRATEKGRGLEATRWPLQLIVKSGYAVATAYYGDIDPDYDDGFRNGIHPLFVKEGWTHRAPDEWGAIGAWAWGMSRILDYLETVPQIDATRTAVMGHSRLGKTALWAGAQDPRFAVVISNNSGCGGAALSRRNFGETVEIINKAFPHWFCENFRDFNRREAQLPVDQHELIALIAPRPVLICSAEQDTWADPRGEFLAALGADPVYRLLGTDGLAITEMPRPSEDSLTSSAIGYRYRPGRHDVMTSDWEAYIKFADRHLRKK
ncbi:MAG: acetylxylan esterase [Planctomycetes bacterium SCN 63-9]|nr:MAG: acetylxylan esterase [Planctomycetes bacterium SCN 63-9]